jgi:predicted dehydrogenase
MTLRVGLIGCGAIGAWHARIVAERPGAVLAAVCDIVPAQAERLAERFGAAAFDDAADLFARTRLDAVIIATPERAHVEAARLAAAAGVPMLIEKPVAPTVADVDAIAGFGEPAGVMVMAGHVERFEAGYAQLKAAVDEGICGSVVTIAARRQFVAVDTTRFTGRSSTLRTLGVHDFDLLAWVHPAAPLEVYAAAGRGRVFAETGLDDHVVTTIRFTGGAVGLVESAWTLPASYGAFTNPAGWSPAGNNRLDVFGDRGMVSNDTGLRGQQLIAFDAAAGFRAAGLRHQTVIHGRVVGALREEVDVFLRAVSAGTPAPVGLADARRALMLTAAAEASLAGGRPVAVAP